MRNISILLILIICLSCGNKEKGKESRRVEKTMSQNFVSKLPPKILDFEFPDTVPVETIIPGRIIYDRSLEKIDFAEIEKRYVFFENTTNNSKTEMNYKEIEQLDFYVFFPDTLGNGHIKFSTVFFNTGWNYLHGVMGDIIIMKTNPKDSIVNIKKRYINVTYPVFVVDKK